MTVRVSVRQHLMKRFCSLALAHGHSNGNRGPMTTQLKRRKQCPDEGMLLLLLMMMMADEGG